jgi:hypothetical protein
LGPVGFRTKLINKRAAVHLKPGEAIERVAIARNADGNFAVAATPSNVYVFELSGPGFGRIAGVVARIPIRKAVVECHASFLTVGRRGAEQPEHVFRTMPGGGAKRLEAYVKERTD